MTKKKIFIIIGIALGIIAIGIGAYFAYKKSKEILTPGAGVEQAGEFGIASGTGEKKKLQIVSDQPVFDYWATGGPLVFIQDQTSKTVSVVAKPATTTTSTIASTATSSLASLEKQVFYFNQSGQIFRAKEGEDEMVSDRTFENLQKIEADKDGLNVIVKYGSLTSSQLELFSLVSKMWQPLEKVSAATFSPDGAKIAYLEIGAKLTSNLMVRDLVGKKKQTTKIFSLTQKDFDLKWFDNDKIILAQKPSYLYGSEFFSVDIKNKIINSFISGNGLMLNWAKDNGEFGLKFESNIKGANGELSLIDKSGARRADMGFSTLPDKCSIGLAKIYCAIPQSYTSFQEPKLPDEYLKRAAYSTDAIYEIDINQNTFSGIYTEAEPALDAEHFTPFDNQLLFVNRYDNKVYSLAL